MLSLQGWCRIALCCWGAPTHPHLTADPAASQTSSRGSWVIHAGLYYPAGSLKARCDVLLYLIIAAS